MQCGIGVWDQCGGGDGMTVSKVPCHAPHARPGGGGRGGRPDVRVTSFQAVATP